MQTTGFNIFKKIDEFGQGIAIRYNDIEISYSDLANRADMFAARLGSGRQLIFLQARNVPAAIVGLVGCLRGGHVVYLFGEGDALEFDALVAAYNPNWVIYNGADGNPDLVQRHAEPLLIHDDLAVLLSTSGSTGSPKFVKLSHKNLWSNAKAIAEYLELSSSERAATTLKYNYSYGLSVLTSHMLCGGGLVLTEDSVTTPGFWEWFRKNGVTSFAGVPYIFEMLESSRGWSDQPSLRYVTQAGGKLSPELVQRFSTLGKSQGWRFFVMYGQTEASPRMAYLPPDEAAAHPDCIGRAIPGGELSLLDADGAPILAALSPGELIFRGDNVMMGYAQDISALAADDTPPFLRTGDIAERTPDGLFRIVGRAARFIKPFGVRVNLDEVQAHVRQRAPGAFCTGSDQQLVVAITRDGGECGKSLGNWVSQTYGLPPFAVRVLILDTLPLLENGKPDYQSVRRLAANDEEEAGKGPSAKSWSGIEQIFLTFTGVKHVSPDSTFLALAGDSLSYVVTSLAIEQYLGYLPADWETKSVRELEALNGQAVTQSVAPTHFLHSARVLMLLLGIPFHVSMWFMTTQISLIAAPQRSFAADLIYLGIHSFRMFAFFIISGYFGTLILRRMAIRGWLRQQAKRLCLPMLTGALILTPLEMAAIAVAPGRTGQPAWPFWLHSMTSQGEYWLSTRWFLATLLGLVLAMALMALLVRATTLRQPIQKLLQWAEDNPRTSWIVLLVGLAPVCAAVAASSRILQSSVLLFGSFEYRTIFYYAPAYFLGAAMLIRPRLLEWFLKPKVVDWAAGLLGFITILYLGNAPQGILLTVSKAAWVPFGLLITRVLLSAMHLWLNTPQPWTSALIEASFVIYMFHMVFVLALNDIWFYIGIWPELAILLSSVGAFGASWLVYLGIRRSKILSFAFNGGPLRARST